ncbi:MAG: hypothetical protein AB7S38_15165 [Vulcanimicrobiota bacterium]
MQRQAFDSLFALLRCLDDGDEIVFFADEGGSWQVCLDWSQVLRAYFACLSQTVEPTSYAKAVDAIINDFVSHDRVRHLHVALALATPAQKAALANEA